MVPNSINQVYESLIVNNKSIIFNILLLIFVVSFPFEYYHDYSNRVNEIDHHIQLGPPEHCIAGTKSYYEIGWSEWVVHKLYRDERDPECLKYIGKISQPRYPNPLDALLNVLARIIGLPILALFNALATAIYTANRLFAQTVFTTIIILAAIAYIVNKSLLSHLIHPTTNTAATTNSQQQPLKQLPELSMSELVAKEFRELFGDAMDFINVPYYNPHEELEHKEKIKQRKNNEFEMKIMNKNKHKPTQDNHRTIILTDNEIEELCTQQALNTVD
jgi:hypothetical protein